IFFVWLGLLPQMQAFEHRLFVKGSVTKVLSHSLFTFLLF
ncbi:hypothetical protein HMPREF1351_01230, partial [Enterococcus faecium 510]